MPAITPSEAISHKESIIPEEVFDAFNEMIVEKIDGNGSATVMQDDVVERIVSKLACNRQEIFDKHWLDVEKIYRDAGWNVKFDKPAYCETYQAYFKFSRKQS